jgi:hypothetical protein
MWVYYPADCCVVIKKSGGLSPIIIAITTWRPVIHD